MLSFANDYSTGAHPKVLQHLLDTNLSPQSGYGADDFCAAAGEKIKAACENPNADVRFLVGGTQTNSIVISTMLREFEGVIAADTGHIAAHEAGAVEYSGHKVLPLPGREGKLEALTVRRFLQTFYADETCEHMVFPGMVYISHPTEYGTLYSKQELRELSEVCHEYSIPLFLDGARLAYGLVSPDTDVTLTDIAALTDVFYIGGTKVGALCGEAVVFTKGNTPAHWDNCIKRRGAMLAKGRLLGAQFDALFTDGLYFEIGRHVMDMAGKLKAMLGEKGCPFYLDSPTNQQFVILNRETVERLRQDVSFSLWQWLDEDRAVVRFVTAWSTTEEDIAALAALL